MDDKDHSSADPIAVDSRDISYKFQSIPNNPKIVEEFSQEAKLEFSEDEKTLITRMFNLVGERWSLIAGRIPGRTAKEIEKYWTSRYSTSL